MTVIEEELLGLVRCLPEGPVEAQLEGTEGPVVALLRSLAPPRLGQTGQANADQMQAKQWKTVTQWQGSAGIVPNLTHGQSAW